MSHAVQIRHAEYSAVKLAEAAVLIGDKNLCKNHAALDKRGKPAGPIDEGAVKFCVRGAIARACGFSRVGVSAEEFVFRSARMKSRWYGNMEQKLIDWNNAEDRTASEVSALLVRSSRLAKREAAKLKKLDVADLSS